MAENKKAFIDIIFNKEGAVKALNQFKKNVDDTFSAIQGSTTAKMASVLGAITGGLSIKTVYDEAQRLGNFADMFKLDVSQVSAFSNTLAKFGGNSEIAVNGLQSIQQAIVDLRTTGGGALKTVGTQIGLNLYDQFGNVRDSLDILDDLRIRFKSLRSESAQIKIAQELGISDPSFLRLLRATDAEYAKIRTEAQKYGVLTQENWQTVRRFNMSLSSLRQSFLALGMVLIGKLEPAIGWIADLFDRLATADDWVKSLVIWGGVGSTSLWAVVSAAKAVGSAFKTVGVALKSLAVLAVGHPLVALLTALGTGIYWAENWEEAPEWFRSFFDWLDAKILNAIDLFGQLKDAVIGIMPADFTTTEEERRKTAEERRNWAYKDLVDKGIIDAPDISRIVPNYGVLPTANERSIVNNNQQSSVFNNDNRTNTVNQYYNLSFNGINNPMDFKNALTGFVQQNAGGVRR